MPNENEPVVLISEVRTAKYVIRTYECDNGEIEVFVTPLVGGVEQAISAEDRVLGGTCLSTEYANEWRLNSPSAEARAEFMEDQDQFEFMDGYPPCPPQPAPDLDSDRF